MKTNDIDILQALEEDLSRPSSTGLRMLSLGVGDSVRIYCPGPLARHALALSKHEVYDRESLKYTVSALCAQEMEQRACRWCAERDRLSRAGKRSDARRYESRRVYLYPVYTVTEASRDGSWRIVAGTARHPIIAFLYAAEREQGIAGMWYRVTRTAQSGEGRYIIIPAKANAPGGTPPPTDIPTREELLAVALHLWPCQVADAVDLDADELDAVDLEADDLA